MDPLSTNPFLFPGDRPYPFSYEMTYWQRGNKESGWRLDPHNWFYPRDLDVRLDIYVGGKFVGSIRAYLEGTVIWRVPTAQANQITSIAGKSGLTGEVSLRASSPTLNAAAGLLG